MVRIVFTVPQDADTTKLFRNAKVDILGNVGANQLVRINVDTTPRGARVALSSRSAIVTSLGGRVLSKGEYQGQTINELKAKLQAEYDRQFRERMIGLGVGYGINPNDEVELHRKEMIIHNKKMDETREMLSGRDQTKVQVFNVVILARLGQNNSGVEIPRIDSSIPHSQSGNIERDGIDGFWRKYTFTVAEFPGDVIDKINELIDIVDTVMYISWSRLDKVTNANVVKTLDVRKRLLQLTPAFTRIGVLNICQPGGLKCAIDAVASVFVGQFSDGKHKITKEDVEQYFTEYSAKEGRHIWEGFTVSEIRDAVEYYNGSYFVAFDGFGDKIVCWKNDSQKSKKRGGLCIFACDGHAWIVPHKKGVRISDSNFGLNKPMPKGMYSIKPRAVDITLEQIEASPMNVVYVDKIEIVDKLFKESCIAGHIPFVGSADLGSSSIISFVTAGEKTIKYCPGATDAEKFARDMKQDFSGGSVYKLALGMLEKMGSKGGFMRSHLNEETRAIFASQSYYHHQWYADKESWEQKALLYGVDVRRCFTWCLLQRLGVFCVGDEPKKFDGIIQDVGFYYLDGPDADKWPLFGSKRWYLGALIIQLVNDNEIDPNIIKYAVVPSKVTDSGIVSEWIERIDKCSNPKGVINGAIGFMKASSISGGHAKTHIFTDAAEAYHYREQGCRVRTIYLKNIEETCAELESVDDRAVYVCVQETPGSVSHSNFLPQWLSIACYASLRVYQAARLVIGPVTDWRSCVKAVCVDSVAVTDAVDISFKTKEECSVGDLYHVEKGKELHGPAISCFYKEPVAVDGYTHFEGVWTSVPCDTSVLDGPGCIFNAGGGWGKSYFMRSLINRATELGLNYLVIGPTGIVKDNYLSAGIECHTAHRALSIDMDVAPLWRSDTNVVFIDEVFAMQSECMAWVIHYKKKWGTRVFMCGDSCQNAPPDGSSIISSSGACMHWLSGGVSVEGVRNYRISGDSVKDSAFAAWLDSYRAAILAGESFKIDWKMFQTVPSVRGLAICPTNTMCNEINALKLVDGVNFKGVKFSIFDGMQLISLKNSEKYYNGQIWTVVMIGSFVTIKHNKTGKKITVDALELLHFAPAYAISCHKLQCETIRDDHTVVNPRLGLRIFGHRWLYTALSRTASWDILFISL